MATLLLAAGGAAIGSALIPGTVLGLTGASIGWIAGSIAGNLLFSPRTHAQGPRLSTLEVTTSTYGVALPEVHGTAPCAGNVIWAAPLTEHENTQRIGKGGGGTVTTYTYTADFMVAVCAGPIKAIRRIWANEKLIYDVGDTADAPAIAGTGKLTDNIRVYLGAADQQPSALIENYEGVGNVPGYRGVALCEFSDFPLSDYGNMLPTLKFEVVRDGTIVCPRLVRQYTSLLATTGTSSVSALNPTGSELSGDAIFLRSNNQIYDVGEPNSATASRVRESVISATSDLVLRNAYQYYKMPEGTMSLLAGNCSNNIHWTSYNLSDTRWFQSDDGINLPGAIWGHTPEANPFVVLEIEGLTYGFVVGRNGHEVVRRQLLRIADGGIPPGAIIADSIGEIEGWFDASTQLSIAADDENKWIVCGPQGGNRIYVIDARTMQTRAIFDNHVDVSGNLRDIYPIAATAGRVLCWYQTGGTPTVEFAVVVDVTPTGGTAASPLTLRRIDTGPLELGTGINPYTVPGPGLLMIGNRLYSYIDAVASTAPTLQAIVERIATLAGYATAELDAADLASITVKGFVRRERMTGAAQLGLLTGAYSFDVSEIDGKMVSKRRGAASLATIGTDDLIVEGDAPAVQSVRAQESELPQKVDLSYMSHGADYAVGSQSAQRIVTESTQQVSVDVPIVLDDDEAGAMTARMLWEGWIGRMRRSFALGPKWSKLVPTDVITLPLADGTATATVRLTSIKRDGIKLSCEAVDVDAAAFTQPAVGGAVPGASSSSFVVQPRSEIYPLDLPPLRDTDDDFGIYAAVSSYSTAWRGAEIFGRQNDGADWTDLATALQRCTMGTTATVLADTGYGDGWYDTIGSVDVDFVMGTPPSSLTIDAFLSSNDNAFLIGDEIIRARTVTVLAGSRVRLTNLIRGLQGTAWARATHAVHERAVWLNSGLANVGYPATWLNQSGTRFAAVTLGGFISDRREVGLTLAGTRLKPLPSAHLRGIRQANGDVLLKWYRRARLLNTWRDGVEIPLDETAELYDVEIWNDAGTAVTRSWSSIATNEQLYAAAQIQSDFGDYAKSTLNLRVYQRSGRVGRGIAATKTIDISLSNPQVLLLHLDGADNSTMFVDSSPYGHTVTPVGNAKISTAQSKFGGSSASLPGAASALLIPDHGRLRLGAHFTVDFWVRLNAYVSGSYGFVKRNFVVNVDNTWGIFVDGDGAGRVDFLQVMASGVTTFSLTSKLALNTWTHIAWTRFNGTLRGFFNGTKQVEVASTHDCSAVGFDLYLGGGNVNAYFDEARLLNDQAAWTANFTPPSAAY